MGILEIPTFATLSGQRSLKVNQTDGTVAKEMLGVMKAMTGSAEQYVQLIVDSLALLMATAKQQGSKRKVERRTRMLLVITMQASRSMLQRQRRRRATAWREEEFQHMAFLCGGVFLGEPRIIPCLLIPSPVRIMSILFEHGVLCFSL